MHARSVRPYKLRKNYFYDIHGGIHTFSHIQRSQSGYTFRCQCTCIRVSFQPNPTIKYAECKSGLQVASKYFHICTPIHILPYQSYPMTIYYPQLNTHHTHMQACIHSRTKASSPRPHAHILRSCHLSTYLLIQAQRHLIHTLPLK